MKPVLVAAVLVCAANSAAADVQATFLGTATYATRAGCAKLKTLAAGTQRNLNTVPETLDAKGFMSWEGGCTIATINERVLGKAWTVQLKCSDGAEENVASIETWTKASDGSILVKDKGKSTRFFVCAAPSGIKR